jgi:opacity protein-like surface antigen
MKTDTVLLLVCCWTFLATGSTALQSGDLTNQMNTEAVEVKVARGAIYGALKYVAPQVNATRATIYDPGVFEGTQNVEFESGGGFGLSLGAVGEEEWYFAGLEFEFLMNSSEIMTPLPSSTIYENINSLDQISLNLNLLLGTDLGDRRLRPYVFGGIGYTSAELVGHYGLVIIGLEDGYDDTFGYHAGIGLDLRIFKNLYLDAGYRYYQTTDVRIETRGRSIEFANSGQMIHIGLAYIYQTPPVEYTSWKDLWKRPSK